jgi:hypothetical protein
MAVVPVAALARGGPPGAGAGARRTNGPRPKHPLPGARMMKLSWLWRLFRRHLLPLSPRHPALLLSGRGNCGSTPSEPTDSTAISSRPCTGRPGRSRAARTERHRTVGLPPNEAPPVAARAASTRTRAAATAPHTVDRTCPSPGHESRCVARRGVSRANACHATPGDRRLDQ